MVKKEVPDEQSCSSRGSLANTAVCVVSITSELPVIRSRRSPFYLLLAIGILEGASYALGRRHSPLIRLLQSAHSSALPLSAGIKSTVAMMSRT